MVGDFHKGIFDASRTPSPQYMHDSEIYMPQIMQQTTVKFFHLILNIFSFPKKMQKRKKKFKILFHIFKANLMEIITIKTFIISHNKI